MILTLKFSNEAQNRFDLRPQIESITTIAVAATTGTSSFFMAAFVSSFRCRRWSSLRISPSSPKLGSIAS